MPPATIRNLTERRVPQYVAIYLGAAWGLVQFVDFIGSRYALAPAWTDLTLVALALLLPTVALYTYHHGRPGPDEWHRSEKIFIPINLLLIFLVLGTVGAGSNLAAVTTHVRVKDEKGNTVEKVVANTAYRKRVAMFMFDAAGGDAAKWLSFGLPWFVYWDLQQQQFVELVPGVYMRERLRKAGFPDGTGVPLTLKRDIANEMHIPVFATGTVQTTATGVTAHVQLYETATAKLLQEKTFTAATAPAVADMVSAHVLHALDIPVLADAKPDMPVTELLTQNPGALRAYVEALTVIQVKDDWRSGKTFIDQAVKLDPKFAAAHLARYMASLFTNQPQEAQVSIQAALDNSYRLPERTQQLVKAEYYFAKQDYQHGYAVLDMLAQLYPDDIQIQLQLMQINALRDNKNALITSLKKVLELDPSRTELLQQLGQVYEEKGDAAEALKYYEQYAKLFPQEAVSFRRIANLHRKTGDHANARQAYEHALLNKPQDVETLVDFAELDRNLGDAPAAEQKYQEALATSKTPAEKAKVLHGMTGLYGFTGEINKRVQTYEQAIGELAKFQPPVMVLMFRLRLAGEYAKTDPAKALRTIEQSKQQLKPPFDVYLPMGELGVYDELQDAAREEQAAAAVEQLIQKSSFNFLKGDALHARGRVSEMRNDCATAIRWYEQEAKLDPLSVKVDAGRCYRKLGQKEQAERELNKVLKVMPANGPANLELALLYQAVGDKARARQYIDRALLTWKNADASFKPALQAKQALAAL